MTEATGLFRDLNFRLRRVLATGAAHGFGAAIAERFHAHGASWGWLTLKRPARRHHRAPRAEAIPSINPIPAP
jgi:NAD(P)-dependent dehydrogenase (short-subunit alcohol dehydrogenase family)